MTPKLLKDWCTWLRENPDKQVTDRYFSVGATPQGVSILGCCPLGRLAIQINPNLAPMSYPEIMQALTKETTYEDRRWVMRMSDNDGLTFREIAWELEHHDWAMRDV